MSIEINFLGHAGYSFTDGTNTVVIDPFLTDNPDATMKVEDVKCDCLVVTHGHFDHLADVPAIAKANDATVIAAFEICDYLNEQNIDKAEVLNPGGQMSTDFGWVAMTQAFHSSSYQGRYMGQPCGAVIHIGGVTIYHCGDTGIFSDMQLIADLYSPEIALIPIGDRFTMGPALATRAAEMIKPKVAVPMHYNTWPPIEQDVSKFSPKGMEIKVLQTGETWTYGG